MLIGVGAKHAKDELREFIEMAKIPVIHSLPAKTILPDDHPYSIGNLGKIGTKNIYKQCRKRIINYGWYKLCRYVQSYLRKILKQSKSTQILKISDIVLILM